MLVNPAHRERLRESIIILLLAVACLSCMPAMILHDPLKTASPWNYVTRTYRFVLDATGEPVPGISFTVMTSGLMNPESELVVTGDDGVARHRFLRDSHIERLGLDWFIVTMSEVDGVTEVRVASAVELPATLVVPDGFVGPVAVDTSFLGRAAYLRAPSATRVRELRTRGVRMFVHDDRGVFARVPAPRADVDASTGFTLDVRYARERSRGELHVDFDDESPTERALRRYELARRSDSGPKLFFVGTVAERDESITQLNIPSRGPATRATD